MELVDYMLSLVEVGSPSGWRSLRQPPGLPDPPPASTFAYNSREFWHRGKATKSNPNSGSWQREPPQFSSDGIVPDHLSQMSALSVTYPFPPRDDTPSDTSSHGQSIDTNMTSPPPSPGVPLSKMDDTDEFRTSQFSDDSVNSIIERCAELILESEDFQGFEALRKSLLKQEKEDAWGLLENIRQEEEAEESMREEEGKVAWRRVGTASSEGEEELGSSQKKEHL